MNGKMEKRLPMEFIKSSVLNFSQKSWRDISRLGSAENTRHHAQEDIWEATTEAPLQLLLPQLLFKPVALSIQQDAS